MHVLKSPTSICYVVSIIFFYFNLISERERKRANHQKNQKESDEKGKRTTTVSQAATPPIKWKCTCPACTDGVRRKDMTINHKKNTRPRN